jgi:transcriptional regulator with XRE-family HTH domain
MTASFTFSPHVTALSFCTCETMPRPPSGTPASLAEHIRSLLASRGLSLAEVARRSRLAPASGRLGHIQHNIYDAIRNRQFNPSLYQLAALSRFSGYRFVDWLKLFGFSLDHVTGFQCSFSSSRTVELDARIYHPETPIPWFRYVAPADFSAALTPLSRWLAAGPPREADSLRSDGRTAFRFVKIGTEDAYAFPNLLPGSIVRIEARPVRPGQKSASSGSEKIFLVETGNGLVCSPIQWTDQNRFVVCARHLPYTSLELETGSQAAIVGRADMEFRRTVKFEAAIVPKRPKSFRKVFAFSEPPRNLGDFLRRSRKRAGLSFREASARTRVIARSLGDPRYFCAPGSLSDYETRSSAPRHIHKTISICASYFVNVQAFFKEAGIDLDALGGLAMPVDILQRRIVKTLAMPTDPSLVLQGLKRRFRNLPFFLHGSIPEHFGMADLSVRDVFWAGGVRRFTHRFLTNAAFLIVDRRKKKAVTSFSRPKWAQPLYVFLLRDGTYVCGPYSRANGLLTIHPCIAGLPPLLRLRLGEDVEVIGRVAGIVRTLK